MQVNKPYADRKMGYIGKLTTNSQKQGVNKRNKKTL